jgi:hypothetical protein
VRQRDRGELSLLLGRFDQRGHRIGRWRFSRRGLLARRRLRGSGSLLFLLLVAASGDRQRRRE